MNYSEATKAMQFYFKTSWNGLTKIAYDDVAFTPPNETWVRLTVKHADGYQATAGDPGNNRHRRTGTIFVQVFQPQNKAAQDALIKADIAASLFIGKDLLGIHFSDTSIREIGNDGQGFYQINVTSQFRYDQIA